MKILSLKKSYDFTCPCGALHTARPSGFMELMQVNLGYVFCVTCKKGSTVMIDDHNEKLVSTPISNHTKTLPDACYMQSSPREEILSAT